MNGTCICGYEGELNESTEHDINYTEFSCPKCESNYSDGFITFSTKVIQLTKDLLDTKYNKILKGTKLIIIKEGPKHYIHHWQIIIAEIKNEQMNGARIELKIKEGEYKIIKQKLKGGIDPKWQQKKDGVSEDYA